MVSNWDDMELVWQYTYENLEVDSRQQPVLLCDGPLDNNETREGMAEVMFETFGTPAFYVRSQAALSLYASGLTTRLVFDCGHGVTHAVLVHKGRVIPHAVLQMGVTDLDLVDYLMKLLTASGYTFVTAAEREIARNIKNKHCYVAADFDLEITTSANSASLIQTYELPDGQVIEFGNERFRALEALF